MKLASVPACPRPRPMGAGVTVVAMLIMACGPSVGDVEKASRARDGEALLRFLAHPNPAFREPAFRGILALDAPTVTNRALQQVLVVRPDLHLAASLVSRWKQSPQHLDLGFAALVDAHDPGSLLPEFIATAASVDPRAFAEFVRPHLQQLEAAFRDDPDRMLAVTDRLMDSDVRRYLQPHIGGIRLRAALAKDAKVAVLDERDFQYLFDTAHKTDVESTTDPRCSVANVYVAAHRLAVQRKVPSVLEPLPRKYAQFVCDQERNATLAALAQMIRSLDVGVEAGSRNALDDASILAKAAVLTGGIEEIAKPRKAGVLPAALWSASSRSGTLASADDKIESLSRELSDLRQSRGDITNFWGFMIASHGNGLYEVSRLLGFVYGVPQYNSKHSLLRMHSKEFTSKGRFSVWARKVGTEEIKTVDGFNETWAVYEEVDDGEPKRLDAEIRTTSRALADVRRVVAGRAKLAKDRKEAGLRLRDLVDALTMSETASTQ